MNQGILYNLDAQEFGLSVIEDGRTYHYLAKRLPNGLFHVSRAWILNGAEASKEEREVDIQSLPSVWTGKDLDGFYWFAKGIGGMPLRFLEGNNGQHSF